MKLYVLHHFQDPQFQRLLFLDTPVQPPEPEVLLGGSGRFLRPHACCRV